MGPLQLLPFPVHCVSHLVASHLSGPSLPLVLTATQEVGLPSPVSRWGSRGSLCLPHRHAGRVGCTLQASVLSRKELPVFPGGRQVVLLLVFRASVSKGEEEDHAPQGGQYWADYVPFPSALSRQHRAPRSRPNRETPMVPAWARGVRTCCKFCETLVLSTHPSTPNCPVLHPLTIFPDPAVRKQ